MGVLSTRSLLGALGISSRRTGEASAAINWVVKDGVGKLSRLLFARWCVLNWSTRAGNSQCGRPHTYMGKCSVCNHENSLASCAAEHA